MARHEGYAGTRPFLDEIQFHFYADQAAALQALAAGAVDGFAGLARGDALALANTERFHVVDAPLVGHQTVLLMQHRNRILQEAAVRRAISLTVDRGALVAGPLSGQAVPAYGSVPAYSGAYSREIETLPDPARAGRLLEESGWAGGPMRSRQGAQLRLGLSVPADDRSVALGEALAGQLQAVGLQIDLQPIEPLDLYRERLVPGAYDLALLGVWLGSAATDPYALWHSREQQGGFNFAGYGNAEADRWLEIVRAGGEQTRRREALAAFQRLWAEDVPSVTLVSPLMTYAISARVRGVRLGVTPDPGARFQYVVEWHLATRRVPSLLKSFFR